MGKNNKNFGKKRNFVKKSNSNKPAFKANKGGKPAFNKANGKKDDKKTTFALQKSAGIGKKNSPSELKSILKKKPVESEEENDSAVDDVEMDSDVSVSSYDAQGSSDIDSDDAAELKRLLKGIKGDGDDSEGEEEEDDDDDESSVEEVKVKTTKPAEKSKPVVAVKAAEIKKKEIVTPKADKEKPVVNGNKAATPVVVPVKKPTEETKQDQKKQQQQATVKKNEVSKPVDDKVIVEASIRKFSFNQPGAIVKEQNQRLDEYNSRCVYIRPIPSICTPGMLKELAPELVASRIPVGKKNQSKGFAFIEFISTALVDKYVKLLNGKLLAGKPLIAAKAVNSTRPDDIEGYDLKSLYVSGLSKEVKLSDLKLIFPLSVQVILGQSQDKSCLGSALVKFDNKDAALQGFEKHNKVIRGKEICVTFLAKNVPKTNNSDKPKAIPVVSTVSAKKRKREDDDDEEDDDEEDIKKVTPSKKVVAKKKPLKRVKSVK